MTNEMKASVEKYLKAREEISFKYDAIGRKMWYRSTFVKLSDGTSFWNESPDHKITKAFAQMFLKAYDLTVDEFVAAEKAYYKALKANFAEETATDAQETETEVEADVEDYAVTVEAQNVAIDAETELANTTAKVEENTNTAEAQLYSNIDINTKTAKFAASKIITITQYNTLCTWAEKVSNGQLDAVIQIKTHLNEWLGYNVVIEEEVIHNIELDYMNGFRLYLAQFPFVVKDDAGYFHKLYFHTLNDTNEIKCYLAEIPSDEATILNAALETNDEEIKAEVKATETKVEVKNDRIAELKGARVNLVKAINNALKGHFINHNGEFIAADDAGYTTVGADALHPAFEHLYRLEDGKYVEVDEKAINAFSHLEIELGCVIGAIHAEIARNAVKFVSGKWYASDEYVAEGEEPYKYLILKRTAKTVTVYNQDQDDWNALKSYDANDEIDGEFDCIFRKKIQFDERGEYVDWEDEEGELVQVFAKNETEPPTDDDDNNDGNDDEDNEETDNGEESTNVEVENNVEEVKEDEPKFEVGKTYYINVDGKPFTLKVEARTQKMLTGTTINGTRKYHVCDTIFGDYVATDLRDEFGNAEMIWAANEYKPEVEATELSDELIDEYIISEEAQTVALRAELYNAERAKGNYSYDLNGEHVFFENNQITRIDATRTIGMLFSRNNGKKQFFTVATQCGRMIQGSMKAIAASKVSERYMAKEKAKAQGEFFHNFFNAYQNNGGFFEVITEIVYADGYDHTFERQFDYFNQAQEFVGEVKKVIGDNPTQIFIKRNQQGGQWFYHLDKNGTEHNNKPETLFFQIFPKNIQERIDELKAAIDDNQQALDQLRDNPDFIRIRQNLMEARDDLKKAVEYYEFILHEKEPCRPFTVEEDAKILTGIIEDFKAQRENATDPAEIAELDKNITDVIKERQDTIQKRMNAIVEERNDICDELDEADGNSEVPQAWIDSREGRLKTLRAEYGRLFELREKFRREVPRPNSKPPEPEEIQKRMSAIVEEREELYDALDEAEANEEYSQNWIDYLEEELEKLRDEYDKLWARLEGIKTKSNVA